MELWEALTAPGSGGVLHCWTGTAFERSSWREVLADALDMTGALRRAGVRPGSRVAAVLTNTPDAVRAVLATWLAGGALASLPTASRGMSAAEYAAQLGAALARLEPVLVLADDEVVAALTGGDPAAGAGVGGAGPFPGVQLRGFASLRGSGRVDPSPPGPDELAFVQYSSGSTSAPKGVMLTARAIARQLEIVSALTGCRGRGRERWASWLPLSHDMGFFGCLLQAWANDFDLLLSTPRRFTFAPRSWFGDAAAFGATVTVGTSTALHLAARAQRSTAPAAPLALRCVVVGAERVDWDTLRRGAATFAPHGLPASAFTPAYGLAEATLAVTAAGWADEPTSLAVDGAALGAGTVREVDPADPAAARVVSTGRPCPGVTVRVPTDALGEIEVGSPSLAEGYLADPERTRRTFAGGMLRTGDLGFAHDGELYVVGRRDAVLSVGGRNVHVDDIESAVGELEPVRKGGVALVDVGGDGRDELVLLAELAYRVADHRSLAAQIADIALRKAGVDVARCVFVRRGALPRTPSGKLRRFRCRAMLAEGRFSPMTEIALATA